MSSFRMLSQKMNEVEKVKKPLKRHNSQSGKSPEVNRSNSSSIIDLDDDNKSPPGTGQQSDDRDPDVPDRSYGDYFCPLCDSHMNSDGMWTAHISGKRHQKNVDKGSKDPKYDNLDVESCIKQEIKNVKDPIVGLSYIHEIRRKDSGAPPIFTCFLCQATFPTVPLTIEHVLSMKHRMNFMKENSPDDYQLLEGTNLKKGHMEPLVEEMTIKLEEKFGKGEVHVKQEKQKIAPAHTYSKRSFGTDDEEEKYPRKNIKLDDKDSYSWKRDQHSKKENITEKDKYIRDVDRRRRHPSNEVEDKYRKFSPPRRPRSKNDYYDDTKRYESSLPRDSYKDSFHTRRAVSPMRPFHHRGSTPPREPFERNNYKIPYGPELPPFPSSSSHQYAEKITHNLVNPPNPSGIENKDDSQILNDFLQKLFVLPSGIFFKLVLLKMKNMEMNTMEELKLVVQLMMQAEEVLNKSLPSDVLSVLRQRLSGENVPSNSSLQNRDSSTLASRPQSKGDLSFIKEFLDCKRSPTVMSSSAQPSIAIGGNVGVTPLKTPTYANQAFGNLNQTFGSTSQTYGTSSQTFGSSNQTYGTSSQTLGSSNQTYGTSSQTLGSSNQTYGNPSQSYGNQIKSSTTQGSYQNRDPSLHSYSASFQNNSYNSPTSSNSSSIPGLNLAEVDNRERQNYSYGFPSNQSSNYPSYGF